MALLEGLYTYPFGERVGFRVADLSGMDARSRANLLKKRRLFALDRESEPETLDDYNAMLRRQYSLEERHG